MSQAERLKKVINYLLESPNSFAKGIGLSTPTSIYDVISGRREITPSLLKRIVSTHTNLNQDWLLNGTGEMLTWQKESAHSELNEDGIKYISNCARCREKDKVIDDLRTKLIESQQQYIECLKEISVLKKASSG